MKPEHAETLKRSIPYSQALRLKRIRTTEEEITEQSKALTKKLVERGYNEDDSFSIPYLTSIYITNRYSKLLF